MSYQALYRKYRSQTFDQMVGQEVVSTSLKNAVANNHISHAYLFSGPRGTGKTSAAKIFAKAINCPNAVDGEPCNECFICESINASSLDDVIELDAASNNGVDEIREIRDKSTYAPSVASYKIYIIDEVHMLSTGAFNALLKTLEEPTDNVVFILATTEIQKIPATILSRVQNFEFKAITTSAIEKHLAEVLDKEEVSYTSDALNIIAKSAQGGMRDALSILDQALSLSDNEITSQIALLVTGSIGQEAMNSYIDALLQADTNKALTELDTLFNEGKNMLRFTEDLMLALRNLLLEDNLEINQTSIFKWIDIASQTLQSLKQSTQAKVLADVMTIRLTNNQQESQTNIIDSSEQDINQNLQGEISRLEQKVAYLENRVERLPENTSQVKQGLEGKSSNLYYNHEQVFKVLSEATNEDRLAVINAWSEVVANFTKPSEQALLNNTIPVAASKDYVLVTFPHENLAIRIMENQELQSKFGNYLSVIIGSAPNIIALSTDDWQRLRADYVKKVKAGKTSQIETDENQENSQSEENDDVVEMKNLLADKIIEIND